jgi:hypothetical protein
MYRVIEVAQLHAFSTLAPDGGDWSASRPGLFTAGERFPLSTREKTRWAPEFVWAL